MYSAYKLNKQDDNIQPWCSPFPIWNQPVVPYPVLTVPSWPAHRFLREILKTPNSQSNLEKEEWSWKNQPPWLQTILQSYSHQNSMVLAQKYRSMGQHSFKSSSGDSSELLSLNTSAQPAVLKLWLHQNHVEGLSKSMPEISKCGGRVSNILRVSYVFSAQNNDFLLHQNRWPFHFCTYFGQY